MTTDADARLDALAFLEASARDDREAIAVIVANADLPLVLGFMAGFLLGFAQVVREDGAQGLLDELRRSAT